jgi:peptidyl-prolyl cis-trans isomerase C
MPQKLALFVILSLLSSACAKKQEDIVARVGKAVISESEFREKLGEVSPDYHNYVLTPYGRRQFLDVLVREKLILQASRAAGIAGSPKFKDRMRKLRQEEERKLAEARDYLLTNLWLDKLREDGTLKATSADVADYHRKHPKEIRARHILLPTAEEAESVLKQIRSGKKFATLAKKHSLDADTAVEGGRMQPAIYGEIIPELEDLYRMRVGEVAGPIRSKFGYHILLKESEKRLSLKSVRDRVQTILEKKKLDEHLQSLQARYPVEVLDAQFR